MVLAGIGQIDWNCAKWGCINPISVSESAHAAQEIEKKAFGRDTRQR